MNIIEPAARSSAAALAVAVAGAAGPLTRNRCAAGLADAAWRCPWSALAAAPLAAAGHCPFQCPGTRSLDLKPSSTARSSMATRVAAAAVMRPPSTVIDLAAGHDSSPRRSPARRTTSAISGPGLTSSRVHRRRRRRHDLVRSLIAGAVWPLAGSAGGDDRPARLQPPKQDRAARRPSRFRGVQGVPAGRLAPQTVQAGRSRHGRGVTRRRPAHRAGA